VFRAVAYLIASGIIWLAEGFLFSRYLSYSPWQTILMAAIYAGLFLVAARLLLQLWRSSSDADRGLTQWRTLSLAPMITLVLGSFISLPLLLLIAALGKI
jgi:hypothetical protein